MAQSYRRELTIVLTGDAKGLTGTVRVTRSDLDALGRTLDKTSGTAERSGKRIGKALDKSEASASRLNSTASRLGKTLVGALSVAALLQTARGLGRMADEYSNIGAQMRQASGNAVSFAQTQATAYGVAQRTTASLAATAQLISNVNRALRSMGETGVAAFQHSAQLAETINQAIALSHVSAASADAALIQLNQGLASGTLRGDELNSVMEQTPRLAAAIAAGMGVTIGQLRAMGAEGKITSQIVVEALKSQAAVLSKEYADLPLTIGRAWTLLTNGVERYVGRADQAVGSSHLLAQGIAALGHNIDNVVTGLGIVTGLLALQGWRMATAMIGKYAGALKTATTTRLQAAAAERAEATAMVATTQARARELTSTLQAIETSRAEATATLAAAQAEVQYETRHLAAAKAAGVLSAAQREQTVATNALTAAKMRQMEATNVLATLGRQQARVEAELATASTAQIAAQTRLAGSLGRTGVAMSALKRVGSSLFALLGGWPGVILAAGAALVYLATRQTQAEKTAASLKETTEQLAQAQDKVTVSALKQAKAQVKSVEATVAAAKAHMEQAKASAEALRGTRAYGYASAQATKAKKAYDALAASLGGLVTQLHQSQAAAGMAMVTDMLGQSAQQASTNFDALTKSLQAKNAQLEKQIATFGKGEVAQLKYAESLAVATEKAKGDTNVTRQHIATIRQLFAPLIKNAQLLDAKKAAAKAATEAEQKATKASQDHKRAVDELNAALSAYRSTTEQMSQSTQDARDKLAGMTQAQIDYRTAIRAAVTEYEQLMDKGAKAADANAALRDRVLAAQDAFHVATQSANQLSTATDTLADTQDKAAQRVLDLQRSVAQEFAGFWSNASSSFSKAFGDLITRQTHDFRDFGDSLGSIAKQMVSDIIAQFARLKIIGPMLSGAMNTVGGWLGYAGQYLQGSSFSQAANYYGGGSIISPSPAMGGAGGSADYGSYLKNGLTAYKAFNWAANGGLWGGAAAGGASALGAGAGLYGSLYGGSAALGAASAAGSFTGAGALAGGTYVGGTGLYASTAGTGVAGAASSVSWIPIVGWIVAAILANVSLYEQGWSASAKVNKDLYSGNALSTGLFLSGLSGPAMIDKGLHALGANDFISSLLSGSSGFTALFGHRAPRLQRGGIDVGFSAAGITGQSYADWKAKGGLFRSDKYGTATGALDADTLKSLNSMWSNIQKSMEQAAQSIGGSVGKSFSIGLKTVTEKGEDEPSKYIVSYLGKTWDEATSEAAQQRIGADAILSVLQQSLGSVVGKLSADWQADAATLADGAQAMLAIQTDIVHGQSLIALGSQASFAQVLTFVEGLQAEGEKLTQTYQRLQAASQAYVQFVGQFEPAAVGFGGVLEGIAKQMQANIDQANALAKAAGMQGAAEKDLTNIHRVAAEQAADAIAKLNVAAQDLAAKLYDVTNNSLAAVSAQLDKLQGKTQSALQLAIGDKSPLSVTEKLALALKGLRSGLTSADDVLSLGKQLYRGADYAGLYNKVQQIIGGPGAGGVGSLNDAISKYTDLYTQQQQLQQQAAASQRFADSKTLAQYVADLSATHGIGYADVAKNLGFSLGSLAKDLGVTNLAGYLDKLKLQDVVGTGMTDSGSIVTAIHDLGRDLLQSITGAPLAPDNAVLTKISTGTDEQTQLLASIDKRLAAIENSNEATAKNTGDQAKTTRSLALRQTAAGTRTMA